MRARTRDTRQAIVIRRLTGQEAEYVVDDAGVVDSGPVTGGEDVLAVRRIPMAVDGSLPRHPASKHRDPVNHELKLFDVGRHARTICRARVLPHGMEATAEAPCPRD